MWNGDDGMRVQLSDGWCLNGTSRTRVDRDDRQMNSRHAASEAAVAIAVQMFSGLRMPLVAGDLSDVMHMSVRRVLADADLVRRE